MQTIKTALHNQFRKIRIFILRYEISKAKKSSYMSLYERIELRDSIAQLKNLEQQLQAR